MKTNVQFISVYFLSFFDNASNLSYKKGRNWLNYKLYLEKNIKIRKNK